MRIIHFSAENFKRIRLVDFTPKNRLTQITGKNGQGKTSVLDAMWALFAGKRAIPDKPVRKGASKSKLSATLGDEDGKPLLVIKRLIQDDRTTQLTVEAAPGAPARIGTPQAVLDALIGEMSFDPIGFIRMDPKKQVEILRQTVKLDVDIEQLNQQNKDDFATRTIVNREVERLKVEIAGVPFQENLPREKVDEAGILRELDEVNDKNQAARNQDELKRQAQTAAARAVEARAGDEQRLENAKARVEQLESELAIAKSAVDAYEKIVAAAKVQEEDLKAKAAEVPDGDYADAADISKRLQDAQLINREIDKRTRRAALEAQLKAKEREAAALSRAMEDRNEKKANALAAAKLPVDGLTFDEESALFNGIPLTQLGEAEQIRVSLALAMAATPKLRAVPIHHGESLDEDALALIEKMAEANDYQVFMARVDSSGQVGIVMHDGEVEADNQ